ncbi:MAG TPA: hypothetical protein VMW50_11570 [Dehalococcoidia bacterium]|nr:hypothetical protein [Dehalococcoidia bacterium]
MWGYLAEFWEEIVQVGDYTIEWFQSIGNAVAGAIGGLFSELIHYIYDCFYLVWWLFDSLKDLFAIFFTPFTWIFNLGKGFFSVAFKTAEELGLEIGEVAGFDDSVFAFFDAFPYFNYILAGVGGALAILFLAFIIKKLSAI